MIQKIKKIKIKIKFILYNKDLKMFKINFNK